MIVRPSINPHSGYRRDVVLPFLCGQVIYVVLVSCLVGYGPATLQCMPRWLYIYFSMLICQFLKGCSHMSELVWIVSPLIMELIYCAVVVLFLPLINNWYEMNRFILSLMHSTNFMVAVRWLHFQDFPNIHLPVIKNCWQSFASMSGTSVSLTHLQ